MHAFTITFGPKTIAKNTVVNFQQTSFSGNMSLVFTKKSVEIAVCRTKSNK